MAKNSTANVIDVLANDTDPEGDTLTVTAVSTPTSGTAAVGTGGANVTYTPNANFTGSDSFTYTISDGHGNTATGNVSVTVNNTAPVATTGITGAGPSNTPLAITLAGTDANGDALTFAVGTGPTNGALGAIGTPSCTAGSCTASVTYTPAANYSGSDSFTFTVNDGTATSTAATVNITVINQAPTANADSATVAKNSTANVIDVLANDTDPEGNTLTVTAVSTPTSGTAAVGTGGAYVTYTPNANFTGTDSFTYTISDGHGNTATGNVSVTVNNTAPVATTGITGAVPSNTPLAITLSGTDANGDALTFAVGTASHQWHPGRHRHALVHRRQLYRQRDLYACRQLQRYRQLHLHRQRRRGHFHSGHGDHHHRQPGAYR